MPERAEQLTKGIALHCGDCLEVLATLPADSIDSCVTDPPYGLSFMGKHWDHGVPGIQYWRQIYRVLKPGAHLLAFGGTRTYHRMACAIEDAEFEVRDTILYLYGSGFPKSHNIGNGWGTALKPACEPIMLARKPLSEGTIAANVLKHGTGALNIDGCRVAGDEDGSRNRPPCRLGSDTTYAQDEWTKNAVVQRQDTTGKGRWPANIITDGSEEVVEGFPESKDGIAVQRNRDGQVHNEIYGAYRKPPTEDHGYGQSGSGSTARFFYTAKADSDDRLGSKHPTVKPLDLIQYLIRLVTPKGGLCLDPFAGTGTLGEAAIREGMQAILIERESEYQADIRRRIKLAMSGPDERGRESIKARGKSESAGPLFDNQ